VRSPEIEATRRVFGILGAMIYKDTTLLKVEAELRNLITPFRSLRESGLWQRALDIAQANEAALAR
jgi:hypothetical protein